MRYFLETVRHRNESLFWFGLFCFIVAILFLTLIRVTNIQITGVNAWYKPLKFSLSIGIFSWTMGWYSYYLNAPKTVELYNWIVIVLLGFEILYIAFQAAKGQLSHFNLSTPIYASLYFLMALAATLVTLSTGYMGLLFFQKLKIDLPDYYVWSIRTGILLFVIFSLEGFVMGSRLSHTIGGSDGGKGLPILNWSTKFGDPRVAHFIGMHALQVIPFLSYYLLKSVKATLLVGFIYAILAIITLIQALQGKPLIRI